MVRVRHATPRRTAPPPPPLPVPANFLSQGHINTGGDSYASRFRSAQKESRAYDTDKIESKRQDAINKYEFDTRRKQWKRRVTHMKALCVVVILSYSESPPRCGAARG